MFHSSICELISCLFDSFTCPVMLHILRFCGSFLLLIEKFGFRGIHIWELLGIGYVEIRLSLTRVMKWVNLARILSVAMDIQSNQPSVGVPQDDIPSVQLIASQAPDHPMPAHFWNLKMTLF